MALLHLGAGLGNGLCNLHNARRARSPVAVVVGDMATWHRSADPVLNCDLESLAATQGRVLKVTAAGDAGSVMRQAVAAAVAGGEGVGGADAAASSIVTVLFPHDISWAKADDSASAVAAGTNGSSSGSGQALADDPGAVAFMRGCAAALKEAGARGKAAILLGGAATLQDGAIPFQF
jgi:acetolactate synthase-1/2/3 large subunit